MDTLHYKFTKPSKLVASFDLDGTLIRTKSGKKFAKDKDDYKYSFDNVIEKLHNLMENGYKIVIFTNQKGISMNKVSKTDIINKIEKLFPFADYFIACNDDIYRKPMIGMYEKFIKLNCEYEDMFYVGDAAGRKGDHSYADINFAYNAGLKFYTENEFFLNINENCTPVIQELPLITNKVSDLRKYTNNVVVIMQGFPGSGKTTFIKKYIKYNNIEDYVYLSNDDYSKSKMIKFFKKGIENEKLIFIDNLNTTKKNRNDFIKLLPEHYSAIGIHIKTPLEISYLLNKQRYYVSNINKNYKGVVRSLLPKVVYHTYNKRYEKMEKDEGFHRVYEFMPDIKFKYYL